MNRVIVLFAFLLGSTAFLQDLQAQNRGGPPGGAPAGVIQGIVLEGETGNPIQAATIAVWKSADSTLATGAITTDDGRFLIEGLRTGRYYVQVSFVGFGTETVHDVALTPENPRSDLGPIRLQVDTALLDEVQVTADRDFMEVRIDRTVYNTRDQLVSTGGSATDVLRNIPSVEVDMDGQVSLRGSQNVAVLVNGRPSQMTGEMLASFLQGLPASAIERVEVIPNPSARYEPDGMSGILNIVLKQDVDLGLSGSVTGGVGTQDSYNLSGMLGYGKGPLNARVNYGFRTGRRNSEGERFNEYRTGLPFPFLETFNNGSRNSLANTVNLTLDYRIGALNTLSFSGLVSGRGNEGDELSAYSELDAVRALTKRYDRTSSERGDDFNMDYGLAFKRTIDPTRHEFTAEARYENQREEENETFRQSLLPQGAEPILQALERSAQRQRSNDASVQADYIRPLGEDGKLEAGYKGTLRQMNNTFYSETYRDSLGAYLPDLGLNNTFDFDEQVHAAYGILGQQLGKIGLQAGVRAEQALTTFNLKTIGEAFDNDYFSLFPSAFMTYKVNDIHQVRFSYSKRINRPRSWFLNPFSDRADPLFRREGNPYLKPEYIHGLEFTYTQTTRLTTLSLSPYYRRTVNVIRFINTVDPDGVTTLTFKNLDKNESFGAEAIATFRLGSRLNGFASFDAYRVSTDASSVESSLSNDAIGWSTRLNATLRVMPGLDVQASVFYRAPMDVEQGRIASFSRSDLAMRQQLFDNRGSLSLRVNDPFNTSGFNLWRDTPTFYLENSRRWDSRSVNLTFTYNFGRQDRNNRRQREDQRERGNEDVEMMGM